MEREPKIKIKEMPSKEDLEDFMGQQMGQVSDKGKVIFDTEEGKFDRIGQNDRQTETKS